MIFLFTFFFNFLFFAIFYFFFIIIFIVFFLFFFKIVFLLFFFLFNIIAVFFLADNYTFLILYLDFLEMFENAKYLFILKSFFVFLFDFFHFLFHFMLAFFDFKNFIGIFFQFYYFLNYLTYETFIVAFDQVMEKTVVEKYNWMPKYVLGDSLEYSLQLNKIVGLFSFNDILREKIFVYRRVGILHSRFWLFRSFVYQPSNNNADERFRRYVGDLVEPSRWLLDFRDFSISDYLDPWHYFLNREVFGLTRIPFFKKKKNEYVSVQLMHNYYSIMESGEIEKTQRVYFNYLSSTYVWYEYIVLFLLFSYLFNLVEEHLQLDLLFLEQEEGVPDQGYQEFSNHPHYVGAIDDNLESKFFENYVMDIEDYVTDDDLSWDFILAQPQTPRIHDVPNLDDFELKKEMNLLLNEFRSFSVLYPFYRLMNKLSFYNFSDFFSFNNSGKCFKLIFCCLLYLPIGFLILFFKSLIQFMDWVFSLKFFFKFLIWMLLILLFVLCFQ